MKLLADIPAAAFVLALLVPGSSVESQPRGPQRGTRAGVEARTFDLTEPIPFHGAQLVGFERSVALRTATGVVQPSDPSLVFVTIKLELASPFEYVRGRFREITLTDEGGRVYRYRGWLTDEGWIQIDEPDGQSDDIGLMEANAYPALLDLHFEIPADASSLVLHYGAASARLFSFSRK